jgi:hypothetical protein
MVGENMSHPLGEIRRSKNKRYIIKSTSKYQIDRDNTKLGGASTKIIEARSIFYFIFYFRKRINQSF